MNAIIALCHFCELHGPRIVFCTQVFCKSATKHVKFETELKESHGLGIISEEEKVLNHKENNQLWKYGVFECDEDFLKPLSASLTETCFACQSFLHNKAAIVSNDDEYEVSFVSSLYPLQEEVFTLVRQACIRSLSCEIYSEQEGPIYFGDEARGHVISYSFFLKDVQARGFQRRYSILVFMKDKMFLLNSWSFFIKYVKDVIDCLQRFTFKVYAAEEGKENDWKKRKAASHGDCVRKREQSSGNPRSLTDLVGDKGIWKELHRRFTWILKAGAMRLQENMVEGTPLLIQCCKQESISPKSFIKLFGSELLRTVLHTIYVGRKLILQSEDGCFFNDIVLFIKTLLPSYLFHPRIVTKSDVTDDDNILIYDCGIPLPEVLQNILIIRFKRSHTQDGESSIKDGESIPYSIEVQELAPLEKKPPQIAVKLSKLLENQNLSKSVLDLYVAMLIDEWNNKIKIWSYISRNKQNFAALSNSPSAPVKLQRHSNIESQCISSFHSSLLLTVGALECDVEMLEALSKYYET